MLRNLFYRGFLPALIFLICIASNTAQGVVFSREMTDEDEWEMLSEGELSARRKVENIISDRVVFNKVLLGLLEKYSTVGAEEQKRFLQETYGTEVPVSRGDGLSVSPIIYRSHIDAAKADYEFYKFFEAEYMPQLTETIYKAATIALVNIEQHRNVGHKLDERFPLRKVISLLTPYVTEECVAFCDRIRFVSGEHGAILPISVTKNQFFLLTHLRDKAMQEIEFIENMNQKNRGHRQTCSIEQDDKERNLLEKIFSLKETIENYLAQYRDMGTSWGKTSSQFEHTRMLVRGINILEALENSIKRLETLKDKLTSLYSPQKACPPSKPDRKNTVVVQASKSTKKLSSASASSSPAPTVLTEKAPPASSAAADASIPLIDEAPLPPFYSQAKNIGEQASGSRDLPISEVNRKSKPTFTRESHAQKMKRYERNRQNFVDKLTSAQPIEDMIKLVDSRISTLDESSIKTLRDFIRNKSYKYQHDSFQAWIRRLNPEGRGGMEGEGGSKWTVSLCDENGRERCASIHTPHGGYAWLDLVSRSNMLYLLQETGFIEWNR